MSCVKFNSLYDFCVTVLRSMVHMTCVRHFSSSEVHMSCVTFNTSHDLCMAVGVCCCVTRLALVLRLFGLMHLICVTGLWYLFWEFELCKNLQFQSLKLNTTVVLCQYPHWCISWKKSKLQCVSFWGWWWWLWEEGGGLRTRAYSCLRRRGQCCCCYCYCYNI